MIQKANFQPNKLTPNRYSIGGLLAVAAVRGMIVDRKSGDEDTLELSTGKAGYFLRRDVASAAERMTFVEQDMLYPDARGFEMPYLVGGSAQAEDYEEVWVEGADLLDASMDAATAIRCPVTSAAGKFAELTDSEAQETLGHVALNEAAENAGVGRRFLIRIARSARTIPAA
jgi:hypothetical protein